MESISRGGSSNNFTTLLAMRESDKQKQYFTRYYTYLVTSFVGKIHRIKIILMREGFLTCFGSKSALY
jgi:hypothetical protein